MAGGADGVAMTIWQAVLVWVAGLFAGTINAAVGSGTLVSFPVLLAVGIPPVTANVSNSVGLFPGSFTGAWGYRRELTGQRTRTLLLAAASTAGAVTGAILLLRLPAQAFTAVVPVLIIAALLLVMLGPRITSWMAAHGRHSSEHVTVPAWLTTLAVGTYGGDFGAAQGVLLMGFLGVFLAESLQRKTRCAAARDLIGLRPGGTNTGGHVVSWSEPGPRAA